MWLFGEKRPRKEEADASAVTFLVRRDVRPYLEAGRSYTDSQQYDLAIQQYETALEIDPNCAIVHFNLGSTQLAARDFSAAKRSFHRAIELEPHCSLFLEHLGKLYFETREYAQSILYFQRAAAAGEMHPVCYGILGRAYLERAEYSKAIASLEELLNRETDPIHIVYGQYYLCLANLGSENLIAARELATALLQSQHADAEVLRDLGEHFLDISCTSIAGELFARVLDFGDDPRAEEACAEIAEIESRIDEVLPQVFCGDEEIVLQNIHLLHQFGSQKVSKALLSILDAQSPLIREAVIEYSRKYGFPVYHQVLPLLQDEKDFVREKCTEFLSGVDSEEVTRAMRWAIFDDSSRVKILAAEHLAEFGRFDAVPEITEALGIEWDEDVKTAYRGAIARIKRRSVSPVPRQALRRVFPVPKPSWGSAGLQGASWFRPVVVTILFLVLLVLFLLLRPASGLP
jgi:tetratricopeptide (TPR) repeat protein